jgi:hypothetical protein
MQPGNDQFDLFAARHFAPLAERAGSRLEQVCPGLFEFGSARAIIRLRASADPASLVLVTIRPAPRNVGTLDDLDGEISLQAIAGTRGLRLDDAWLARRRDPGAALAGAAEALLVPFVTGIRRGLAELREVIYAEARAAAARLRDRGSRGLPGRHAVRPRTTDSSAGPAGARKPGTDRPRSPAGSSQG